MTSLTGTIDGKQITIEDNGMVRFGGDDRINVLFYKNGKCIDEAASRAAGRPVYMAKDYVLIQHPGERDTTDRPVTELDKQRWPQKWQQYINASEQVPDGTPIDILLPMHPEIASNMHSMGVHTIEQMANITADGLQRLGMGGVQLMNKAKDFLDKAERGVAYHRMESELAKRDNAIEVLANQNKMLKEQLDRLMAQITGGVPAPMIPTTPPATAFGMVPVPDVDYKHVNEARAEHHEATVRRRGRPPGTRNKPK